MKSEVLITKASGMLVPFSRQKLWHSLQKAGGKEEDITKILTEVQKDLYQGISTKEIYDKAFELLKKNAPHTAAKYKLKKAIQDLGPTGYPFENYVAEILHHEGFQIQVGQIVQGHCVKHEVDVIAEKDEEHFMIECKFHSDQKRKCDVKIPLYIQSRFKDVEKAWMKNPDHSTKFHQGWVVTNTRFTEDAIQYGSCVNLFLMSWDYPINRSLKERIDLLGLHPVTALTSLTKKEKQMLLNMDVVLSKEICKNEKLLNDLRVNVSRKKKIIEEAMLLCEL